MERLTFDGNFCEIAQCREMPCQHGGSCSQRKVWERLKEYEDSGLTPEECAVYGEADREGRYIVLRDAEEEGVARLRELALADKDGRVMVFPCNVGDALWCVTRAGIKELAITSLEKNRYGYYAVAYGAAFRIEDFGKDVFTTRKEAEEKFKEGQKDDERNVLRVREGV